MSLSRENATLYIIFILENSFSYSAETNDNVFLGLKLIFGKIGIMINEEFSLKVIEVTKLYNHILLIYNNKDHIKLFLKSLHDSLVQNRDEKFEGFPQVEIFRSFYIICQQLIIILIYGMNIEEKSFDGINLPEGLIPLEIGITSLENKNGQIYEFMNKGDKRYKRIMGTNRWRRLCKFNNTCITLSKCGDYCEKHRHGMDHTIIKPPRLEIIRQGEQSKNSKIGDLTEEYCRNDIASLPKIQETFKIGHTGDKISDIIYKFQDEDFYRGVQVKTLSKYKEIEDKYYITQCNKYGADVLIIGYNEERNRFVLIMSEKTTKSGTMTFSFAFKNSKYSQNMFTNKDDFIKQLSILLRFSRKYTKELSLTQIKEEFSLNRLEILCKNKNISYSKSIESGSIYDCIINNYKIQHKSTSKKSDNLYEVNIYRSGLRIKGKYEHVPYSENDNIDFVIIEIIDFQNNFYIIPKLKLVEMGIFSSNKARGLTHILIPYESYKGNSKYKWLLNYLNQWSLLTQ